MTLGVINCVLSMGRAEPQRIGAWNFAAQHFEAPAPFQTDLLMRFVAGKRGAKDGSTEEMICATIEHDFPVLPSSLVAHNESNREITESH